MKPLTALESRATICLALGNSLVECAWAVAVSETSATGLPDMKKCDNPTPEQVKESVEELNVGFRRGSDMNLYKNNIKTLLSALAVETERLDWCLSNMAKIWYWNGRINSYIQVENRSAIDTLRGKEKG